MGRIIEISKCSQCIYKSDHCSWCKIVGRKTPHHMEPDVIPEWCILPTRDTGECPLDSNMDTLNPSNVHDLIDGLSSYIRGIIHSCPHRSKS